MKLKSKTSKKTASNDALDKNIIIFSAVFIFWVWYFLKRNAVLFLKFQLLEEKQRHQMEDLSNLEKSLYHKEGVIRYWVTKIVHGEVMSFSKTYV